MSWKPGEKLSVQRLTRLSGSIPSSYTVVKIGSKYYAECNFSDGTSYSGDDAGAMVQEAIDSLT